MLRGMQTFPTPEDPLGNFAISIFRINGALLRNGDRITKSLNQSSARWHVLGQANFRPQTVAQIARNMGQSRQSVQRIADALAVDELVLFVDNSYDKRAKILHVTAKGKAVISEINVLQEAWSLEILHKLDPTKLAWMSKQLDGIALALEQQETVNRREY